MKKKVAILFGIDHYYNTIPLKNAINDAQSLSKQISELGFETECFTDVEAGEMERELEKFSIRLKDASVGLFFFAGHGVQCKNENFLCTTDTNFFDEISVKHSAFSLNEVIDRFEESKVSTKIIILDACRNNPFAQRSGNNGGLAPMYAPTGTIIAFSTSPGQVASDGKTGHGIYTEALLEHIVTPRLSIEDMFKRVRNTVSARTGHKQITWEHTSLMGSFYFNPGNDIDEIVIKYGESALKDEIYDFSDDSQIEPIVTELKTYNWYHQNPAIDKIMNIDFYRADKDDIFILGRNIYQAACGESGSALQWLEELEYNLEAVGKRSAIHLLNGMLFEIYFSSDGRLREKFKMKCHKKPFSLCSKNIYPECKVFICDSLSQYPDRIIYLPGTKEDMLIDLLISTDPGADYPHIDSLYIDGLSCLYDEGKTTLYKFDNDSWRIFGTLQDFKQLVVEMIGVPLTKAKFTCNEHINEQDNIYMPRRFSICRYI